MRSVWDIFIVAFGDDMFLHFALQFVKFLLWYEWYHNMVRIIIDDLNLNKNHKLLNIFILETK